MPEAERFSRSLKEQFVPRDLPDSIWTRESGRYVFVEGAVDGSVKLWKQIEMSESRDEIAQLIASQAVSFQGNQVELADARV